VGGRNGIHLPIPAGPLTAEVGLLWQISRQIGIPTDAFLQKYPLICGGDQSQDTVLERTEANLGVPMFRQTVERIDNVLGPIFLIFRRSKKVIET
jgi:hypothetical protein